MKFLNKSQQFNKIIGSPAKRAMRAGKKEGGLGEGIFARPPFLGGGWVCVAFGDAQVSQNFAQKRFALRPVIAKIKQSIYILKRSNKKFLKLC
jgi:phospholipase C